MKIILKHIIRNIKEKKGRSLLIILSLIIASVVFILNLTIPNQIIEANMNRIKETVGLSDLLLYSFDEFNIYDLKLNDDEMSKIRRKDIGFVFQFYNLVQNLTVEENIMLPVVMNGEKESNYKERLNYILKTIGLENKRKSLPSELSGGQQQRVSIARAIILKPSILFADEPIGNLDSKAGREVMDLFKKINEDEHITILQVTHSEDSAKYGNRIIRLKDGKILGKRK